MTQQEIQELAGHRQVPAWVVKLVGDCLAKEREQEPVAQYTRFGKIKWLYPAAEGRFKGGEFLYTHPQPKAEQEPVAWQERHAKRMKDGVVTEWTNWYPCPHRTIDDARAEASDHIPYEWRPVYTHPQPKQPLTDEQIATISVECATVSPSDIYFARAIEAAHGIKGD